MAELKNGRWEKFSQNCFAGMTERDAYVDAGFKASGKEETLRGKASRLRSNAIVAARISELQAASAQKLVEEVTVTKSEVLRVLKDIATFDLADCYDENNNLKSIHDIPKATRQALAGIKVFEEFEGFGRDRSKVGETREIKAWDKNRAVENLGRYLKMFTDKVEHSGTVNLGDRMKAAQDRLKKARDGGGKS